MAIEGGGPKIDKRTRHIPASGLSQTVKDSGIASAHYIPGRTTLPDVLTDKQIEDDLIAAFTPDPLQPAAPDGQSSTDQQPATPQFGDVQPGGRNSPLKPGAIPENLGLLPPDPIAGSGDISTSTTNDQKKRRSLKPGDVRRLRRGTARYNGVLGDPGTQEIPPIEDDGDYVFEKIVRNGQRSPTLIYRRILPDGTLSQTLTYVQIRGKNYERASRG